MSESNVPEIIKYLTEDNLKLMYSRLNRRYMVVDALPSVDSLEPADKNVIYVVKETVGETVRYWPNVLDNDVWKPFGIGQADLDGKADKVEAVEGHLVVADKDGNLVDADILPGTFVALAFDPDEEIQPHATDIRKVWEAFQSGIPVMLLDNRTNGTGLYASLNAAGYTWPAGDEMAERLTDVDDNYRPYDDSVQGYYFEGKFYDDAAHTTQVEPINGEVYHDIATDKTYIYGDETFTQVHRFIQFTTNELIKDEPAWTSRTSARPVFYRIFEPVGSATANNFDVVYGESTGTIKDDMTKKADKVSNAVQGHFAGLDASGNLTDSGAKASDFATAAQGRKADTALQEHQDISGKADKSAMDITYVEGDNTKKHIQLKNGLGTDVVVKHQDISGKAEKSEMKVTAGDGVAKVQLKDGLSVDVITDISGKQDVIDDLEDIRSGAAAGATAYQKPSGGIPKSDLDSGVQASLGKADTALQEHQDISGKADKDADAVDGNLAMFDNGNPVDSGVSKNNLVKGARIGSADPLPVEQGIIVIPESATVNDGKLSIKVGSNSPVVFTANEADDKTVTIDKSGIGLGNVDNTSDADKPISTATQTALDKKADKVTGATNGHLAGLNASGNLTDSGKKASDFATSEQGAKADTAYQKPAGGIPKSDLDSGVQASLGKADTALQEHQDITGKANKDEMSIDDVPGDTSKKTIQLKEGLSQVVVVDHQDISGKVDKVEGKGLSTNDFTDADKDKLDNIEAGAEVNVIETIKVDNVAQTVTDKTVNIDLSGKAEKSEMSITDVTGDASKKNIQLKSGLSQVVVIDHQDISGKADINEMAITDVSGDATKKNIQLYVGLDQDVVVAHQDVTGKAEKNEMAITEVAGDATKKNIQLKSGLDQDVVVAHQDITGKAEKDEMAITAAVDGDATKKNIQLKNGLAQDVVVTHQDVTGKAEKNEMAITAVAGDTTKKNIQLKNGLDQDVVVEHQDITGKADKVSGATSGNFAALDANGNLVDSTYKPGDFKTKQTAVVDPTASGTSLEFIATASQDANGEMTVEKKTVQDGTTSQKGVVQLEDSYSSTSTTKAATPNSVKGAYDALDTAKADKVTGATDGDLAGLDANGNLTDAGVKPSDFIKGVQKNGTDLTPDQDQKVNVVVNDAKLKVKLGSGSAVEKFSADASQDSTIEIPVASYDDTATPTTYSEGLMTGQEKEKLANVEAGAQENVIEKVQKNGTDLSISNKTVNVPVGTGMLKTKIGSAQSAIDLFGADSSTDATLEIPMASADTTGATPVYTEGLMSGQDKEKLDGIEAGAEENDVETVSIGGGTPISPTANTTNIDIPMAGYTSGATPTYTDGAMAGQDKKKLDDLKNFSSVVISDGATPTPATTTIVPADHNSALTFKAGANVTLSAEPSTDPDTIVISATGGGGDPVTVSGGKGISVTPTVDPTTSVTDYEVSVSGAIGCIGGKSSVNVTASDCDAIALPMTDAFDSGNDRFIIQEDQTDHHVYLYALKTVSGQTPATRVDGVDMFTVTFNVNLTRSAIQSGVTQHGFYGLAGIKVLRKHSSVVTLADSSESYAAEVGAASINLTVTIQNNSGTETTIGGKAYYGYRFVYYGDAPAIDSTTQLPVETIDLVSRLTSVEETVGIAEYSGTIPTYTAGTAIDMTSDVVSLQYNRGLMVNSNNQLEVRLGEGLDYLPDPQNPAIIAIGIHNDVEEVVEEVKELETTINTTVTTNMDFADITGKFDLAGDGSHTGDGVLLGYTFTVPLANKLYLEDVANEWVTKIGVYAAQTYSQNYCIIGIYEFDFNQHPVPTTVNPSGYAGYTVPLCDTGRVKLHAGLNEFSIKHMNAKGETELSFKPDCIYYAAIYVSKNCGQNLSLAGKPGYNDPFNDSLPVMSMDMCNLNLDLSDSSKTATELDAISFNDFGWWGGGSGSSQTQAYHECPNAHRFFMMVRNVKAVQSN
jgi:hypothetical protein